MPMNVSSRTNSRLISLMAAQVLRSFMTCSLLRAKGSINLSHDQSGRQFPFADNPVHDPAQSVSGRSGSHRQCIMPQPRYRKHRCPRRKMRVSRPRFVGGEIPRLFSGTRRYVPAAGCVWVQGRRAALTSIRSHDGRGRPKTRLRSCGEHSDAAAGCSTRPCCHHGVRAGLPRRRLCDRIPEGPRQSLRASKSVFDQTRRKHLQWLNPAQAEPFAIPMQESGSAASICIAAMQCCALLTVTSEPKSWVRKGSDS